LRRPARRLPPLYRPATEVWL